MHLSKRYLKDIQFQEYQLKFMRSLSRLLFIVVVLHTILIIYAALWLSKEAWAFISGGLFYIIFGVILLGQFLYMKFIKSPKDFSAVDSNEEWFDIVNPEGKIIGKGRILEVRETKKFDSTRLVTVAIPKLLVNEVRGIAFNRGGDSTDV